MVHWGNLGVAIVDSSFGWLVVHTGGSIPRPLISTYKIEKREGIRHCQQNEEAMLRKGVSEGG